MYSKTILAPRPQKNPWNTMGKIEKFTDSEIKKLIEKYQNLKNPNEKQKILDMICRSHLDLISSYAQEMQDRYHECSVEEIQNLMQEGFIGLIKAVQKFDLSKKSKWITYASWQIKGGMHHYLRDRIYTVKRPTKFYKISRELSKENADSIDKKDIASYQEYMKKFANMHSFNHSYSDDEGEEIPVEERSLGSNYNIRLEDVEDVDNKILIEEAFKLLTDEEKEILIDINIKGETKTATHQKFGYSVSKLNKILDNITEKVTKKLG
jgi:RNA polymerase sigma-B factor